MDDTWGSFRERVDARRARGERRNSIIDEVLDEFKAKGWPQGFSQHALNNLMGEIVEGGSDTTASLLMTIVQLLAVHPEVQARARVELDLVCGTERSPDWSDFSNLPYINCMVKEAARWRPGYLELIFSYDVLWLMFTQRRFTPTRGSRRLVWRRSPPHSTFRDAHKLSDLQYDGMRIPKGASLLLVMDPLHRDGEVFSDVDTFDPDRYRDFPGLAHEYAASSDYKRRDHYIYGAGRRICPGIHLAERSLWRITAKIIWGFDIAKAIDPVTGNVEEIDLLAYTSGAATSPKPFKVDIKVRSDGHKGTIEREFADAQDYMQQFED